MYCPISKPNFHSVIFHSCRGSLRDSDAITTLRNRSMPASRSQTYKAVTINIRYLTVSHEREVRDGITYHTVQMGLLNCKDVYNANSGS
jgi:hypothetical protein